MTSCPHNISSLIKVFWTSTKSWLNWNLLTSSWALVIIHTNLCLPPLSNFKVRAQRNECASQCNLCFLVHNVNYSRIRKAQTWSCPRVTTDSSMLFLCLSAMDMEIQNGEGYTTRVLSLILLQIGWNYPDLGICIIFLLPFCTSVMPITLM